MTASGARLVVRGLEAGWERTPAVRGVDLDVAAGEIVAVLGGNGSGKSSLLWAVAGLLRPRRGRVALDGRRVDGLPPERIATLGLRLLPQTRRVFPSLSVGDNLDVVDLAQRGGHRGDGTAQRREEWLQRFPVLAARLDQPAASLSGGEQQLLAIGRVVCTAPDVLLLDEPSAGLAPSFAAECSEVFRAMAAGGAAIVLVEQNLAVARRLATRSLRMRDGSLEPENGPQPSPTGGMPSSR